MTNKTRILEHAPTHSLASLTLAGLIGLGLVTWTTDSAAGTVGSEPQPMGQQARLDKAAVRSIVAAHIDEVRDCYNAELIEDGSVAGDIVIAFTVAVAGSVYNVTITESTMPASFDACMAAAVGAWKFPSAEFETHVSYPFAMSPG